MRASLIRHFLTFSAGVVTVLAFAPTNIIPLVFVGTSFLIFQWHFQPCTNPFTTGFAYGLGLYLAGVSWVYVSMVNFGGMTPLLSAIAAILLAAYLSLYPAVVGYIYVKWIMRLSPASPVLGLVFVLPTVWILLEYLRAWLFTGFPWLLLGYSQVSWPLSGFAPLVGVFGVTWLILVVSGLLLSLLFYQGRIRVICLSSLLLLFSGGWLLKQVDWANPVSQPLRVSIIQGNVSIFDKWNPAKSSEIIDDYLRLSAYESSSDLIVWPEAAIPLYLDLLPDSLLERLTNHGAGFLIGIAERKRDDGAVKAYNSVMYLESGERTVYRKRHLVPFGEYLPLRELLQGLLAFLDIPMSNFSSWTQAQEAMTLGRQRLGVTICYEDAFQKEVAAPLPEATLLINVSEDAWFGDSLAPHQRIQMAQMRSQEYARPMLRSANSGVSALIDHRGRIVASTAQFVTDILRVEVVPMHGATPFLRFGNTGFVLLILLLVAGGYAWAANRNRRRRVARH